MDKFINRGRGEFSRAEIRCVNSSVILLLFLEDSDKAVKPRVFQDYPAAMKYLKKQDGEWYGCYENEYKDLAYMEADCKYFLGSGERFPGCLRGGNVKAHIQKMRDIYRKIPDDCKPDWISEARIDRYAHEMMEGR